MSKSSRKRAKSDEKHKHRKKSGKRGEKGYRESKSKHNYERRKTKDDKGESEHRINRTRHEYVHVDETHLYPLGEISNLPVAEDKQIDPEGDYFTYHNHFRLYLYRRRGIFFEDLKSDESRVAFREFCKDFNSGYLEEAFYDSTVGLPIRALDECKRTKHNWSFRLSERENKTLDIVREGVRKQTEYDKDVNQK